MKHVFCIFVFVEICCAFLGSSYADEPTVTLTQKEIQSIIAIESEKAVDAYRSRQSDLMISAKDAYEKINHAFAPKSEK